jgi:hypothetical protein
MSVQVKRRRDTAANIAAFTPAQGEIIVDATNNRMIVGDGATVGGFPAAKLSETLTNTRRAVSDAATAATASDRTIAYTALTAARIVSLPAASTYPTGTTLTVVDESGACSSTLAISLAPNGTDTIDGLNSSAIISVAYGSIGLMSNGVSKWVVVDFHTGAMGAFSQVAQGPNGAAVQFKVIEQTVTLSGATTTAATPIPANCLVLAVGMRVLTAVTGAPSFGVGVSGNATQFGGALNIALGSTNYGIIGPVGIYSATNLIVTATSGSFTAGQLRLSMKIMLLPPSSS